MIMQARTAIGLMSGTSLDGIDAAILGRDINGNFILGPCHAVPYEDKLKLALRVILGGAVSISEIEGVANQMTEKHAKVVNQLLDENNIDRSAIDVIGFHGHTIMHKPNIRKTWQVGDGAMLAKLTGIDVVNDFRSDDVAAGGQGAPFAPVYHQALAANLKRPLAVLNIGGVANVTWIGLGGQMSAFDTGPGNALIDDWVRKCGLGDMDWGGELAAKGRVDHVVLQNMLRNSYFTASPPKSLDRDDFTIPEGADWSANDGAATLTAFTAHTVAMACDHFAEAPVQWLVCGGGRHNSELMGALEKVLDAPVNPVEKLGWRGDFLEAEAFAYLAIRHIEGLPLSFPETTGVPFPTTGGKLHKSKI